MRPILLALVLSACAVGGDPAGDSKAGAGLGRDDSAGRGAAALEAMRGREGRYVAQSFKQDTVRAGWVE